MREVLENEVFPNKQLNTGAAQNISTFDMAFYPSVRGAYNYDLPDGSPGISAGLENDGSLSNPESRWGGITRSLTTTDFEASNIDEIEFWVMDPYNSDYPYEDNNNADFGDLYINLGSVSEDVLRDSRRSFENGLPNSPNDLTAVTTNTTWGVIPTIQTIVNAFDNTTNSNAFQDIGLDGLSSTDENTTFEDYITAISNSSLSQSAKNAVYEDPSSDDYHYFRGSDYDEEDLNTIQRYLKFNGVEGNSPTSEDSPEPYPTSSTTLPSTEDLNNDNNLNETESYFQYKISMKPQDLFDENGVPKVGQNNIVDYVLADPIVADGSSKPVYWFQFKVPIRKPDKVVNGIADFRSIRFMRMFMKGFVNPVILRFARLNLVRSEWRKYDEITTPGVVIGSDPPQTQFYVSAVNIDQNGNRQPLNYVVPPGIQQELDVASTNLRALNEQAMVLTVEDLEDGDSRAAYRNLSLDVRSYGELQMFTHMEKLTQDEPVPYGELSCFIRLGTDFEDNYYEWEIPLTPSEWGNQDPYNIWPEANNVTVQFNVFQKIKNQRNQEGLPTFLPITYMEGNARVTIKGNPTLSAIKVVMIGVRNPKSSGEYQNPWVPDDGKSYSAEVWVNELRLTNFIENSGWAATARVDTKLADLGNLSVAGSYSTPGFGSIDQKVDERSRYTAKQLDLASNFEVGRFFPESWRIKIPFFYGLSIGVRTPQFDPAAPDIKFSDATEYLTPEQVSQKKFDAEDFTKRSSINFTNVRKERSPDKKKSYFWDVENIALSYSYNKVNSRDYNIDYDDNFNWKAGLNYVYNPKEISWKPFNKSKLLRSSNWLKLIKDFNIGLVPKQLVFRTDMTRAYTAKLLRSNVDVSYEIPQIPQYTKSFNWNRNYVFKYDFSKNLRFDYNANNLSYIIEPEGAIEKNTDSWTAYKDSIWSSIKNFGENQTFNQAFSVNYTIPFNKLPLTDWISATAKYGASYEWMRAPLAQDTLGNTIQNANDISLNGQLNMVNLYNKIGFLNKINQKYSNTGRRRSASRSRPGTSDKTEDQSDEDGKKKKKGEGSFSLSDTFFRILMMVKNISATYSQTNGLALPGYDQYTQVLGMNYNFTAPGWGFITGKQEGYGSTGDFADYAAESGWLVKQPLLNNKYLKAHTEQYNIRANIEPIPYMRLEITSQQTISSTASSFYRWVYDDPANPNPDFGEWQNQSAIQNGNISQTITTLNTAFIKQDPTTYVSPVYDAFLNNRPAASERLASESGLNLGESGGYFDGYGSSQQQVVLTSFIAAYSNKNVKTIPAKLIESFPAINWRITYDGFMKSNWFKKYFKTFTLSHAYRSILTAGYTSNLDYSIGPDGYPARDISENFISEQVFAAVTISEQFAPLINVDMQWNNSLITKVEFNRDRTITLNMTNLQVLELIGQEYVFGLGYRISDVKLPFKIGKKPIQSDLTLRCDVNVRNSNTVTRSEAEVSAPGIVSQNLLTAGNRNISIKISADYIINRRLNVRYFYDQQILKPLISTSFPTSNISTGISLRFTLSQ
jgi:cell surface protein SprA